MPTRYRPLGLLLLVLVAAGTLCAFAPSPETPDQRLQQMGFVDVQRLDTSIRVHLVYATPHNFMGKAVYQGLTRAWLHRDAAAKLIKAQRALKRLHPDLALMVYDAARPFEIQQRMWKMVRGTAKVYYVANPAKGGGLHNYGMAVDVTLVDAQGVPLPMGTPFDWFGMEAHTDNEQALVKSGKITPDELRNRQLLRRVMREAGFTTIRSEWWHFNACSREVARRQYRLIR